MSDESELDALGNSTEFMLLSYIQELSALEVEAEQKFGQLVAMLQICRPQGIDESEFRFFLTSAGFNIVADFVGLKILTSHVVGSGVLNLLSREDDSLLDEYSDWYLEAQFDTEQRANADAVKSEAEIMRKELFK